MRVRQKNFQGETITESVGSAVERAINEVGGYGYGQIEQLEAELRETQRFLYRLCDVLSDALSEEDIYRLFDRKSGDDIYRFEVVEDQPEAEKGVCVYCGNEASGEYTIHQDGMDMGPEVDLCNACATNNDIARDEIWDRIRRQGVARRRT